MDLTLESKACFACAKGKRRCGRQIPRCGRCESRGISCDYRADKTFSLPPRQPDETRASPPRTNIVLDMPLDGAISDTQFDLSGDTMPIDDFFPLTFDTTAIPSPPSFTNLASKGTSLPWYLESSSWNIEHVPPSEYTTPFCNTVLREHIEHIQEWQARWVNTGNSPYIHRHVYKFQLPRCIQDAYTTLSTYMNRTPENRGIIELLVEERVRQLLSDQPAGSDDDSSDAYKSLSTFDHMARVHALHIYQTIALFDGAIRMRHVAETQIPTLNAWLRQLISSARAEASLGPDRFVLSLLLPRGQERTEAAPPPPSPPPLQQQQQQQSQSPPSRPPDVGLVNNQYMTALASTTNGPILSPEDTAWYAWAFSETIRRTWMIACSTQTIYLALQLRWAPCPGSTMITTRQEIWNADSAFSWASACDKYMKDGGDGMDFVSRQRWDRIFESRRPHEVDEFTSSSLEITYGTDRMERWRSSMAARE